MSRQHRPRTSEEVTAAPGPAEVYSIRLAPTVHAQTLRAAEDSGLAWGTWAARRLAEAAASASRFGTLEDVLGMQIARGGVERLAAKLGPVLLGDPALLRGAIAAAWAVGRGPEIRAACERISAADGSLAQLSKRQREILLAIHHSRPYDAGPYQSRVLESLVRRGLVEHTPQSRVLESLVRRGLVEHTPLGWRTTSRGQTLVTALEQS